jgi:hypothetical protein
MPTRMHQIAREMGAAFAVLAIYMLVLLAPLHQMGGLQRDLARLGYESSASWSVCTSVENKSADETPLAAKCPVSGVAKFALGGAPLDGAALAPLRDAVAVVYAGDWGAGLWRVAGHPGQPRAPPAFA